MKSFDLDKNLALLNKHLTAAIFQSAIAEPQLLSDRPHQAPAGPLGSAKCTLKMSKINAAAAFLSFFFLHP